MLVIGNGRMITRDASNPFVEKRSTAPAHASPAASSA